VVRAAITSLWSPKIERACVASARAATWMTAGESSPAILIVDHDDSFTYNLVDYLEQLGASCKVVSHDRLLTSEADTPLARYGADGPDPTDARLEGLNLKGIVLSPGPCRPDPRGAAVNLIRTARVPVLGVCLGMQAICVALGGQLKRVEPVHGRTSPVYHDGQGVFSNLPVPFLATRYHSLAIDETSLPSELRVVARSASGIPMGLRQVDKPIEGVQFHPESILSECGFRLLANWLESL
jgi:para-aminobenzoate synthetase component 2